MVYRFADNTFSETYVHTIGVDFKIRMIRRDDIIFKLQIWDFGMKPMVFPSNYYKGVEGILVVYDVTKLLSFHNVVLWLEDIKKRSSPRVTVYLVGNKVDLIEERVVSFQEGQSLANQYQVPYFETSTKDGTNVEQLFESLTLSIFNF
uniref:GTP-binding protein n=1 Tax=Arcella intermedia TaxID=1963864 RepID=A0A6B2LLG8_9EUKA